ncbi:MAG: hypothetical protein A2X12_07965 [Bacteroidetes bacterium GWE2_29_8]|nr:MAG: hypothetical protein A2X12_07965 [Bacteroidetes bacterium GWE2_29_8]OFY16181.1 MAG: hypothetical protein A2X02_07205 [Bacteroidetes bacterium GWF2_29_10]
MSIITLTTDWGLKDYYVANVKGYIYSHLSDVTIVDITHLIKPLDISEAAFIFKNSYNSFPSGTVHILSVDDQWTEKTPHVLVKHQGHYFIGADNGIFSLALEKEIPEKIIELDIQQDTDCWTFYARDIFANVACKIINGESIESMGSPKASLNAMNFSEPSILNDYILGNIIYIDNYQNAITNITEEYFKKHVGNKKFTIHIPPSDTVSKISKTYNDAQEDIVLMFSSTGYLEIALNRSSASSLLGLKLMTKIRIEF